MHGGGEAPNLRQVFLGLWGLTACSGPEIDEANQPCSFDALPQPTADEIAKEVREALLR